jgi:putative ABC transport system permease protein
MNFLFNLGVSLLLIAALVVWGWFMPWYAVLALAVIFVAWMALSLRGRQAASVTSVGISTLRQRLGSSSVVVIGIAGVVGVLVALLAMSEGYGETLRKTGSEDTAIVLRGGSATEVSSVLTHDNIVVIEQAAGVARDKQGNRLG